MMKAARYVFLVTSTASSGGAIGGLGRIERMAMSVIEFWSP